jgi:hypothetical protein
VTDGAKNSEKITSSPCLSVQVVAAAKYCFEKGERQCVPIPVEWKHASSVDKGYGIELPTST